MSSPNESEISLYLSLFSLISASTSSNPLVSSVDVMAAKQRDPRRFVIDGSYQPRSMKFLLKLVCIQTRKNDSKNLNGYSKTRLWLQLPVFRVECSMKN